jgi:hypothetical protein
MAGLGHRVSVLQPSFSNATVSLTVERPATSSAPDATAAVMGNVVGRQGVAPRACAVAMSNEEHVFSAIQVDGGCGWFKVVGIYTRANPAKMVNHQSIHDRSLVTLKHHAVSVDVTTPYGCTPIPIRKRGSLPHPAGCFVSPVLDDVFKGREAAVVIEEIPIARPGSHPTSALARMADGILGEHSSGPFAEVPSPRPASIRRGGFSLPPLYQKTTPPSRKQAVCHA